MSSSGFDKEARAFVAAYDRLDLFGRQIYTDFPTADDKSKVRVLLPMAEFLSGQRSNPLIDLTIPALLAIGLADSFLKWAADLSMPRWMQLFDAREELRDL
ncbi:hypothetical protein A5787_14255 [Mycobacterium sp. 852002-50816_SCH5313054-b]|uniref:hypothetical protein n=1 Tax=Mycobacterium sp. 852002-50816_SCH5313054-b TaxID=1834092 RepID=UPI0007FD42EC|nr:hypothetical protein [Mycobacterium sp. 852002-50816_SCH5313054-b]OBF43912.1 hypothetical protein A5787_14255 [Mycobacterium sp. 852002-50816_SCH5313054-b]